MPTDLIVLTGVITIIVLQFVTKKQIGIQIFILLASSFMAGIVGSSVSNWLAIHNVVGSISQPTVTIHIVLTLLPVIVAWLAVPKDHFRSRQLLGAVIFTAVLLVVLASDIVSIVPSSMSSVVGNINRLEQWRGWIVAVGIAYGIFSLYFVKSGHRRKGKE